MPIAQRYELRARGRAGKQTATDKWPAMRS
jgi:hypothetical protein